MTRNGILRSYSVLHSGHRQCKSGRLPLVLIVFCKNLLAGDPASSNEMGNGMAANLFKRIQWMCFVSPIPIYLQGFPNLTFDVGSIIEN